jgi:hypothetical protein
LLLVGTPGSGKRALGNYLAERSDYIHLDFENRRIRRWVLDSGSGVLRGALRACRREHRGVVITWNVGVAGQFEQVERLRGLGFECLWLDADGGAACQTYFGESPSRARRFRVVDAFESDGEFRSLEGVASTVLERPAARPRLAPVLEAALGRVRQGGSVIGRQVRTPVAVGVALAAAVAGTSLAAIFAVPWSSPSPAPRHVVAAAPMAFAFTPGALPRQGELVAGRSLAGVALGDTMATVRKTWGRHYVTYKSTEWLYFLPVGNGNPAGAGVEFHSGKVVAVFTLGSPYGWQTENGLKVGQYLPTPAIVKHPDARWEACSGYGAHSSAPQNGAVTSILTNGEAVYGFELSRPSVSPCV